MESGGTSPSKTPISSLQEICQRLGKTPQYDLMAQEGRAHQPQFVFRCTVGDTVCQGQGGSKKTAKHASAEAVLKAIRADIATSEELLVPVEEPVTKVTPVQPQVSQELDSTNPVGALQELVVGRGWRLPIYTLYAESGPAHKKEFVMCCAVESYKEFGSGTAKKHAKRNAALNMLNKIHDLPPDEEPRLNRENKGKTISFDILYNSNGEKIGQLPVQPNYNLQESDPCQDLETIAKKSEFSVQYHDIDTSTSTGEFQCLIYLTTQPALCAHGQGSAVDECRSSAAKHAIRMLEVFSG